MPFQIDRGDVQTGAAMLLIFASGMLAFDGALQCEFVDYDDLYVFNNPAVLAGLTWDVVQWAFSMGHTGNWHPLTWLPLMADSEWRGVITRPT
jgi:hypothetical protein